ncbi:recombination regulator RecX [Roseateles sp.]|uniref:recombination regulator RecX n=1 Tax=Roseateles sp. TaxID=1971397 RepID=UPI00286CE8D9|nr:recombination regulator RecX [Roseateles sp.]
MKPTQSLKMRAIGLLSRREHSRVELRRKLQRIQRSNLAKVDASAEAETDAEASAELDPLLDWLLAQGYLSDARFVESRVHVRAPRYGSLRIKQELAQHGLSLSAEAMAELKAQEFERAKAIWQRKFGGEWPSDAAVRAKQMRFLIMRGFAPELVHRLLRCADET